jgi:hypothetical protein
MTLFINKKRTNDSELAAIATHTYSALQYNLHRICSRVISGGGRSWIIKSENYGMR